MRDSVRAWLGKRGKAAFVVLLAIVLLLVGVRWWQIRNRPYVVLEVKDGYSIYDLSISPDGTRLTAHTYAQNHNLPKHVVTLAMPTGEELFSIPVTNVLTDVTSIGNDNIAYIHYDNYDDGLSPYTITFIHPNSGQSLSDFDLSSTEVSVSMDQKYLLSTTNNPEPLIQIWDTETWQVLSTIPITNQWNDSPPAINPSATLVAMMINIWPHEIQLWDLTTGEKIGSMVKTTDQKGSIAPSETDKLITFSQSTPITNPHTAEILPALTTYADIDILSFSPDGKTIVSCGAHNGVDLWDVKSMKFIKTIKPASQKLTGTSQCQFHPFGKFIVFTDYEGLIVFVDITSGQEIIPALYETGYPSLSDFNPRRFDGIEGWAWMTLEYLAAPNSFGIFSSFAISPDGSSLIVGTWEGELYIYDLTRILPAEYFEE